MTLEFSHLLHVNGSHKILCSFKLPSGECKFWCMHITKYAIARLTVLGPTRVVVEFRIRGWHVFASAFHVHIARARLCSQNTAAMCRKWSALSVLCSKKTCLPFKCSSPSKVFRVMCLLQSSDGAHRTRVGGSMIRPATRSIRTVFVYNSPKKRWGYSTGCDP